MKQFPSIPRVANAPDGLFDSGHLWLLENVDGANVRFQLRRSGRLRFGDRSRVYESPDAVPDPYQHAVRHVQASLDRSALRDAVDDVEDLMFFGEAMHPHAIDYDWDRTPSVLGFDVWNGTDKRFLGPDVVKRIFERLGLDPVSVFERERNARDFDPDSYAIPRSAFYRSNEASASGLDPGAVHPMSYPQRLLEEKGIETDGVYDGHSDPLYRAHASRTPIVTP